MGIFTVVSGAARNRINKKIEDEDVNCNCLVAPPPVDSNRVPADLLCAPADCGGRSRHSSDESTASTDSTASNFKFVPVNTDQAYVRSRILEDWVVVDLKMVPTDPHKAAAEKLNTIPELPTSRCRRSSVSG